MSQRPYKIAIVGGIGSGKSVVSRLLRLLGILVYECDAEAKRLMNVNESLRLALMNAVGREAYGSDGRLDRRYLANYMFGHADRVALVNSIVHPVVRDDFREWAQRMGDSVVAVETAILFESGLDADVDAILLVYAPEKLRVERAMRRDDADEASVRRRMENQRKDEELMSLSTYTIYNDDTESVIAQVKSVLEDINEKRR
jgi:dephospho-CoA kinase